MIYLFAVPGIQNVILRNCGNVEIGAAAEELTKFNYHRVVSQRRIVASCLMFLFRELFKPLAR